MLQGLGYLKTPPHADLITAVGRGDVNAIKTLYWHTLDHADAEAAFLALQNAPVTAATPTDVLGMLAKRGNRQAREILGEQVNALLMDYPNINAAVEALGNPEDGETPTAVLQRLARTGNDVRDKIPPGTPDGDIPEALDNARQSIIDSIAQIGRYEVNEAVDFLLGIGAGEHLWGLTRMGNLQAKRALIALCQQNRDDPVHEALQVLLHPRRDGDPLAIEIARAAGLPALPTPRR